MKGYIKLSINERAGNTGICAEADTENIGLRDKIVLLHGFKEVLKLSESELLLAAELVVSGIVADTATESTSIDLDSFSDEFMANFPTAEEILDDYMGGDIR